MHKATQAELDKAIEKHNAFAYDEYNEHPPVDFGDCIYENLTFNNAWLGQVTFNGSRLINCVFNECVLPANWREYDGFGCAELINCTFNNCDAFNISPIPGYFNKVTINGVIAIYDKDHMWVSHRVEVECYHCNHDMCLVEDKNEEPAEWFLKVKKAIYHYIADNPI